MAGAWLYLAPCIFSRSVQMVVELWGVFFCLLAVICPQLQQFHFCRPKNKPDIRIRQEAAGLQRTSFMSAVQREDLPFIPFTVHGCHVSTKVQNGQKAKWCFFYFFCWKKQKSDIHWHQNACKDTDLWTHTVCQDSVTLGRLKLFSSVQTAPCFSKYSSIFNVKLIKKHQE